MLNQFVKDVQMYASAKNKRCGELAQIVLLFFSKTFKVCTVFFASEHWFCMDICTSAIVNCRPKIGAMALRLMGGEFEWISPSQKEHTRQHLAFTWASRQSHLRQYRTFYLPF